MEKILVPTDFSPHTAKAFNYAIQIAYKTNATLTILHDYHVPVIHQLAPNARLLALLEAIEPIASDHFIADINRIHSPEILENVRFNYLYNKDLTIETIVNLTEKGVYDLLIVTAKERNALRRLFFNSVVTNLIKKVKKCAILAVPENAKYANIRQIAYCTKLQPLKETFAYLKETANTFCAAIHFVHVFKSSKGLQEKINHFNQKAQKTLLNIPHQLHLIKDDDQEDAILDFLHQNNHQTDLISFVERTEKEGLSRFFINSIATKMASEAPVPVLIFQTKNKTDI